MGVSQAISRGTDNTQGILDMEVGNITYSYSRRGKREKAGSPVLHLLWSDSLLAFKPAAFPAGFCLDSTHQQGYLSLGKHLSFPWEDGGKTPLSLTWGECLAYCKDSTHTGAPNPVLFLPSL